MTGHYKTLSKSYKRVGENNKNMDGVQCNYILTNWKKN